MYGKQYHPNLLSFAGKHKLSEFVGVETFEEAIKIYLHQYKDTPVSMETFCNEFAKLCNKPGLKHFFEDWIYSTNGPKSFIASC